MTKPKKPRRLTLTRESLRVSTGLRAGSGSATRESNLPHTITLTRDVDPQETT